MKQLLLTTIAAVALVGCGESQQSSSPVATQLTETVWDSLRNGRDDGICTVSDDCLLGFWLCRGFDSLHPLHLSTLQSEQFTAPIEQWGFWFSQRIQWASSEIWRSNSVLWSLCFSINWWIYCCCLCLRRFISLLRSQQSSSFVNVDVALTLSLNVIVTCRFTRKYWFEYTLLWFHLIVRDN